ncbi:MAG: hypothetical protein ACP5MD_14215 [Verrucomicrobiia bacterium]
MNVERCTLNVPKQTTGRLNWPERSKSNLQLTTFNSAMRNAQRSTTASIAGSVHLRLLGFRLRRAAKHAGENQGVVVSCCATLSGRGESNSRTRS